jgi:type IV secretory pathway VirB9-like protein
LFNALQVYPISGGALYQVYAAPGRVTAVVLQGVSSWSALDRLRLDHHHLERLITILATLRRDLASR